MLTLPSPSPCPLPHKNGGEDKGEEADLRIRVLLFAVLKDFAGREEIYLKLADGMTCRDILSVLEQQFPFAAEMFEHSLIAVNGEYADKDRLIGYGDEIAVLPPVSGG